MATRTKRKKKTPARRVSRTRRPEDLSLEQWQRELRRQYGAVQPFELENTGAHPVFSDFLVMNPEKGRTYRVVIRSAEPGRNFCSCPDFATNLLGTCKHVEFTLARLAEKRGGARALREGWTPPHSSISLDYGAGREVRFRAGAGCPAALVRLAAKWFPDGILPRERYARFERFLREARTHDPELRAYDDALRHVAEVRDVELRHRAVDAAFPEGIASRAFERLLSVSLYDYQRQGILFAARAGRCLIGDEMGLGKTVQAIGAVEVMARCLGVERVLVVAPASLKHQWEREIERLAPRPATVVGGLRAQRDAAFAEPGFYKIMNYDTVHRDLDSIRAFQPDLVILDEAQRIKNWSTRAAQSVKSIESEYAIVLTGTPLENRLEELVSIVEFVDRFRLGPTYRFLDRHQNRDETGRVIGYRNLGEVSRTLESIVIRRRKKEVLSQLPERTEKRFFVPLTRQQAALHEENREIVARIVHKWRRHGFLSEIDQRRLTAALQRMRMVCDSTYLLDPKDEHGTKADEVATLLEEILEDPDAKVVVFSQWLRMHELLARRIEARGWEHVLFHGGVDTRARKGLIDRFRGEPGCRIFLSTDAGGVGLNLQHASVVVNVDLPWNPAVLEQRIGRVHRIGQTRKVLVVDFVAEKAIEEQILSVLAFKKSLFAGVLDGGETEVALGGTRLGKFMESVEQVTAKLEPVPAAEAAPPGNALAGLLEAGAGLVAALGRGERMTDAATGEEYVKVKLPRPETLSRVASALQELLREIAPE